MGITNFYCGMALGFDMLAAEEVISLKVELPNLKLIAVIPYDGQNDIEDELAEEILSGKVKKDMEVTVTVHKEKIVFETK